MTSEVQLAIARQTSRMFFVLHRLLFLGACYYMLLRAECKPILRTKVLESSEEIDFFEVAVKKGLFKSLIFLSLENLKIKDNKVETYL